MISTIKRFTFPKSRRLTQSAEFAQVKKNGRVYRGRSVLLSILRANDATRFRAGFITSRALGPAVARNRVRRRLREIVRKHQREIVDGTWIVTIARANAVGATYQQLEVEWLRLAKRASILATPC
ncbi:MAG: ribonuclease P protein component [Verrucomicrobia bacterium]|nr:MAG: ribonuclease P protein component [Verrucomicrobiota bacterium]PYL93663.1 MAG: ribonuclease P protein component [Verrucomicrobiota bacterium]